MRRSARRQRKRRRLFVRGRRFFRKQQYKLQRHHQYQFAHVRIRLRGRCTEKGCGRVYEHTSRNDHQRGAVDLGDLQRQPRLAIHGRRADNVCRYRSDVAYKQYVFNHENGGLQFVSGQEKSLFGQQSLERHSRRRGVSVVARQVRHIFSELYHKPEFLLLQ